MALKAFRSSALVQWHPPPPPLSPTEQFQSNNSTSPSNKWRMNGRKMNQSEPWIWFHLISETSIQRSVPGHRSSFGFPVRIATKTSIHVYSIEIKRMGRGRPFPKHEKIKGFQQFPFFFFHYYYCSFSFLFVFLSFMIWLLTSFCLPFGKGQRTTRNREPPFFFGFDRRRGTPGRVAWVPRVSINVYNADQSCSIACRTQISLLIMRLILYLLSSDQTFISSWEQTGSFRAISGQFLSSSRPRTVQERFQSDFRAVSEPEWIQSGSRTVSKQFRSNFGAIWEQFWTIFEQFWSNFGAISEQFQNSYRPVTGQFQSSSRTRAILEPERFQNQSDSRTKAIPEQFMWDSL